MAMKKVWLGSLYVKLGLASIFFIFSSCQQGNKSEHSGAMADPPNFVLLMGDDHGWDEVGYNSHPYIKTPVLDDMASQGLRFNRFYSGHPSCSPTRGSFITGRHPNRYGTFSPNWSIRPEEITIGNIAKKAGYATAHFGKWHLGPVKHDSPTNPGAMGFDEWLSHDNFFELNPVLSRNGGAPKQIEGEGSEIIIDEAIQFIRKADANHQQFLVLVWFGSPHEPYSGLDEDLAHYSDLPTELDNQIVSLTSNETGQRVERPLREVLQERYAEITAMDRAIGTLRDFLKREGLHDNTLLWYCGDNGTPPSAARTGMTVRGQKGTMYQGGILVPGVIEWPNGIEKPISTDFSAVTSDILPTICELIGQPLPDRPLDGLTLMPVVSGFVKTREDPLYFWSFDTKHIIENKPAPYIDPVLQEGTTPLIKMMGDKYTRTFRNFHYTKISDDDFSGPRTIIDNGLKLVLVPGGNNESNVALFDLKLDPQESVNLAEDKPEVVKAMQKQLKEWQQSVLKSLTGADYN